MAITTSVRTLAKVQAPRGAAARHPRLLFEWARGPARYEDGKIVMLVLVEEHTTPRLADGIETELARVHTPEDAVAFVGRFGLLEHGLYWPESQYADIVYAVTPDDDIPSEEDEPFSRFAETAEEFRQILRVMRLVRATADGDRSARTVLGDWVRTEWEWPHELATSGDVQKHFQGILDSDDFLQRVTSTVADILTRGLQGDRAETVVGFSGPSWPRDPRQAPDRLTLAVQPPTLRAFCYWSLAQKLITRAPILMCAECQHDFVQDHKRQRFCTRNCTRRARHRTRNAQAGGQQ